MAQPHLAPFCIPAHSFRTWTDREREKGRNPNFKLRTTSPAAIIIVRGRRFGYHRRLCFVQARVDHVRRGRIGQTFRRPRAQARDRRDRRAGLAADPRQCRDQCDDGDRLHDARLAVAAARWRRARSGSISICRSSCSASASSGALSPIAAAKIGAAEKGEGLRQATHQALLSALLLAAVAWIGLLQTTRILTAIGEPPDLARDAGTYMLGFQWASRRASSLSPAARSSPRSSVRAPRCSPGSSRPPSTRWRITR